MAKETKVLKVKDVEVVITDDKLVFEKDGQTIELARELGKSDYRTVYEFLKKKGNGVKGSGIYSVGNFSYRVEEGVQLPGGIRRRPYITVSNKAGREIGAFSLEQELEDIKYPHQFVRNLVINYLLTTLE